MQFIKTHLISLLCGVCALAFLGVTAWGMMVTSVKEEMDKRVSGAAVISSLQSGAKNQDLIDAEKLRLDKFQAEFAATVDVAREINRRKPLIQGVFPKPESPSTPYDFRDQYKRAMRAFSSTLLAGGPPSDADINEEVENVKDLQAMEEELEAEKAPKEEKKPVRPRQRPTPRNTRNLRPARPGGGIGMPFGEVGGMPMGEGGHGGSAFAPGFGGRRQGFGAGAPPRSMRKPTGEPKYDPNYRALVAKARSIRCYVVPETSFHVSSVALDGPAPSPQDMWEAQVGLWIQQDVVDAIAEVNNKAALAVRDGDAFVEQMPVKRIESLQVHGYVLAKGNPNGPFYSFEAAIGERRRSGRSAGAPVSFTGREPDDQFDVVQFSLTAFVDQRDLLEVIDRICSKNFYKCIGLEYRKLQPEDEAGEYVYGTGPVVRAKIQFEGYMARPIYAPWMPKEVRAMLGIEKDKG